MSGWTCGYCGGPVKVTPLGKARKHRLWRASEVGLVQIAQDCPGRTAVPVKRDMAALVAEVVAERFGAPGRRQ
jgi:hypothetical protein